MNTTVKYLLIVVSLLIFTSGYSQVRVLNKTITDQNISKRFKINVEYPQIENYTNERSQDIVNQRIKMYTEALVDSFRKDMLDWDVPTDTAFSSEFEIGYNINYSQNDMLSLSMGNYSYYAGAAHPNTVIYSMNYDLLTGNPIALPDLFVKGSDYLNFLSTYTQQDLTRQGEEADIDADMWWFNEGASPKEENFNTFLIGKDSLTIIFNRYQVGPYAIGEWQVGIPYKELSPYINKEGVLGRLNY